jgi:ABC-type sugar transport system permease subunit/ABC-type glycerol-3-phosphate transport system substrate-binding protein
MNTWKFALTSAVLLTILWLLKPGATRQVEQGVQEIVYMGNGGAIAGPLEDVIRLFEEESRIAHSKNPSRPIYRVISGQNASRNQAADPTRFLVSVAGGVPPDVIHFNRHPITEWANIGAFTPLNSFLERDQAENHPDKLSGEDFLPACWKETICDDPATGKPSVFGIPVSMDNRALFYNKDLLIRAGYVDEKGQAKPPRTWEEIEEMTVRLTERDANGQLKRVGFAPYYGNSHFCSYSLMNGGRTLGDDGKTCVIDNERNREALRWVTKVYDSIGGAQAVTAFQSTFQAGELDPFVQGKVALKIDGSWQLARMAMFASHMNYGIAPMPLPTREIAAGRYTTSWMGGWCYAIPSSARNKEGAWELIRFLSSDRALKIFSESRRQLAEGQGQLYVPNMHPKIKFNEWQFNEYVFSHPTIEKQLVEATRMFLDLLKYTEFRPISPAGQFIFNAENDSLFNAMFHKYTPERSLELAQLDIQRALDRVHKPKEGPQVNWNWFIAGYVTLLGATALGVYQWDTRAALRRKVSSLFSFLSWKSTKDSVTHLDGGAGGQYFRAQWKGGWICAAPWIIGFIVFTGGPLLFSLLISFCHYDVFNPAKIIGLENFRRMFWSDPLFWKSFGNTLFMMLGIPIGMSLSLGIALLLNQKVRGVAVWRTFFYLPSIVPAVASSILWIWIFNPNAGLLNSLLEAFGISGPNWLQDERTSKISLILMGLWGAGGGMIIWLAGLKGISESYYEAAELDGASAWQKFRNITLPLLSPYIFFNLIMALIGTFQIFTQAFIMTQGGPVNSTLFYAYHLFNQSFRYLNMGYAAAMAWFLFVIILGITLFQLKMSKRWVHYEGD